MSRLTVRPDIFLRLPFFDELVDVKAADFIQPQPAHVFRPKFDDPALLLNGGGTLGVLHGIEIRQVLRRVIGKLWGAFQHRQIIARPVNVERFYLRLRPARWSWRPPADPTGSLICRRRLPSQSGVS